MNKAQARKINRVERGVVSHAAPSGPMHARSGRKIRNAAQPSVTRAMLANIGVIADGSEVSVAIQAPVMPTRTSTSGTTQQVDATIEESTAKAIRPRLRFFFDGFAVAGSEEDSGRIMLDIRV
ncbi:hypothetical protein BH11PSE11_BH11PSE11_17480 [soil metagenome]